MRAVNLLPRDVERTRSEAARAPLFAAGGGFAAVTAAAVVMFMSASSTASDQRSQLDSLEASISRVPAANQPAVASGAIAQERTDRVAALSAALTARVPLDRLLREVSFVLPEDAWLTGLTAAAPTDAGAASPTGAPAAASTAAQGVTIQGATYSHRSVARVLARLSAIPSLDQVRLTASARVEPSTDQAAGSNTTSAKNKQTKKQKTVVTFSIGANLRFGSGT